MKFLAFEDADRRSNGRIREARFETRSSLPVSAGCVVANGVREVLSSVLKTPVTLRLLEPLVPDARGWAAIVAGANLYAVRGSVCDAAFVLRPGDALALAAAAFGESDPVERPLSPVEAEIVARAVRSLAGSLAAVCGTPISAPMPVESIAGYTTYFELWLREPASVRLGIALSREPDQARSGSLELPDLGDVPLEIRVEAAHGTIAAADLLDLRPGVILPMKTRIGESGLLKLGASVLGHGECGAVREHHAIRLQSCPLQG